jgi:hypothetical protein
MMGKWETLGGRRNLGQIGSMKIKGKLLVKVKIRLVIITIV